MASEARKLARELARNATLGVARLAGRWWAWVAVIVLVAAYLGWGSWGAPAWLTHRLGIGAAIKADEKALRDLEAARGQLEETKAQLAQSQGAIAEMSKRIQDLARSANEHKAAAQQERARADQLASEAAQLRAALATIDARRAAQAPVGSLREGKEALHGFGIQ